MIKITTGFTINTDDLSPKQVQELLDRIEGDCSYHSRKLDKKKEINKEEYTKKNK